MSTRRPATKTLKSVLDWFEGQGLSVYGPSIDFKMEVHIGLQTFYDLEHILKLAKLNKKYPQGIPYLEEEE